jgi:hypothetical protein
MLIGALQEPFLAVVVDPVRTMASGKVEIGAFRTYPEGYKPPDEGPSEYQTIPLSKIEDFGVHAKQVRSTGPSVTYHMSSGCLGWQQLGAMDRCLLRSWGDVVPKWCEGVPACAAQGRVDIVRAH